VIDATHPYLAGDHPIALAHRGGSREAPENSLAAFSHAVDLGFKYLELDVRATSDGRVMVFHDATLNRVTDGFGRISALPYSEVRKAKIAGKDRVLSLEELSERFPEANFNIDVKDDSTVEPFLRTVRALGIGTRMCVGSFSAQRIRHLRAELGPEVVTSLAPPEVGVLVAAARLGPLTRLANVALPSGLHCAQVPQSQNGIPIVTRGFIAAAHRFGFAVHVWTVDEQPEMDRLLDLGIDGIVTDRPTLLRAVMKARGYW